MYPPKYLDTHSLRTFCMAHEYATPHIVFYLAPLFPVLIHLLKTRDAQGLNILCLVE